jgi:Holliday junction resolvase RusA-like endonuclease
MTYSVFVPGDPIAQGSMRAIQGKHARFPSVVPANKQALADWRAQLAAYIRQYIPTEGVDKTALFAVRMEFYLRRPSSHFLPANTRRTVKELRPHAPEWVQQSPDIDKLTRAVLDATTDAGLWNDDAQAVFITAQKKYADDPGRVGVAVTYSTTVEKT